MFSNSAAPQGSTPPPAPKALQVGTFPRLTTCSYMRLDNLQLECVSVLPTVEPTDRNASPTTHCLVPLSQISPTRSAAAPSSLWPSRPVTPSAAQLEVRLLCVFVACHTLAPAMWVLAKDK